MLMHILLQCIHSQIIEEKRLQAVYGNCLVMFSWNFVIKQYVGSAFKESLVLFRPVVVFSLVFLNLINYSYTACLELPLPLAVKDLES